MNARLSLTWGAGEIEQGRELFETLDAVRHFLAYETDLSPEQVEGLIRTGHRDDSEDDAAACTQFDCNWINLKREKTP